MPHVWLEYLNERQEHDFKVMLGDIISEREKIEEMEEIDSGISNPSEENDDTDFEYQPLPTGDVDPKNEKEPYSGTNSFITIYYYYYYYHLIIHYYCHLLFI